MNKTKVSCVEKLPFDTQAAAQAAATLAQYQHGGKFKVYQCKDCHLWHLSSA